MGYAEQHGLTRIKFQGRGNRDFACKGWVLFRVVAGDPAASEQEQCSVKLVQVSPQGKGPGVNDRLIYLRDGDLIATHIETTVIEEVEECEPVGDQGPKIRVSKKG